MVPWLALAAPALGQLYLLVAAVAGRFLYPYDLEWMEGGMLDHAARLAEGSGIYVAPTVDFIPYPYTPLYPAAITALGGVFGISYQTARAISIASMLVVLGFSVLAVVGTAQRSERGPSVAGAAIACGLIAAAYPWVEGWYDIARVDMLYMALVLGGVIGVYTWARTGTGWRGQARVAVAASALALAYFAKQNGVVFVAGGGAVLLCLAWRRAPVFVATAGAIGLGGTWIIDRVSDGWFWTYAFEVMGTHDFHWPRFWDSFGEILGLFPIATAVIAIALIAVATAWIATRTPPRSCRGLLVWTAMYALGCVVGAMGFGKQWAHFNAFIPALVTGAVAAGTAVVAIAGAVGAFTRLPRWAPGVAAGAAALALSAGLAAAWWSPARFVPSDADRLAGDRLIAHLAAIDGEVCAPFHPWYTRLAGKGTYLHRQPVWDISYARGKLPRIRTALAPDRFLGDRRFAAILWDNRPVGPYFSWISRSYRKAETLPRSMQPRLFTGAKVVPAQIWVPRE